MVTRTIHIEIVTSLSTPDFIAGLKRFIARRRLPSDIYSDCGRNFIGAQKEISKLWKSDKFNSEVCNFLADKSISWHFNPPGTPHFGGIWEAGIKSVKHHLLRTLGTAVLTLEDMTTVTTQIEACLNSRPLTQLSSDPNDLAPLTPGHFLTGNALSALPEPDVTTEPMTHLSRWKLLQRAVQQFWKRSSFEYLSKLQQRPKWYSTRPNLQIGDLVVLKDERFPPMRWKLARIVEDHPGPDGLTRVYTIKTTDGTLKRSITKLCPLPIDSTY
ncbi:unnamed protein product [Allacma fusca]|uniref:Integrase catalytic domain-containing protein n=1 Tax=Allacma fusca TaxID=39272 RepID=A0A8J2NTU5_9HEXA|nr:unnamed protein product [Allacma fusca]